MSPSEEAEIANVEDNGKKVKVSAENKLAELQEDSKLFTRMLSVAKSRSVIDLPETVTRNELSVVPRLMSAADRTMLHCHVKGSLNGYPREAAKQRRKDARSRESSQRSQ